ncbi:MAG: ribosome silencing factor [Chlamydiota bacterium]
MEILDDIAQCIYDKKGFNILAIDVRGVSSTTDYIMIAEANVKRHAISIAEEVCQLLKAKGEVPAYSDGMDDGEWIVLDFITWMIHIFLPDFRAKYQIERLFPEGKIIDLQLKLTSCDEKISG